MTTGLAIIWAGGVAGVIAMLSAYALERLCWRSAKLNSNPGLYLRAWGKWYLVIKAGV